MKTFILFFIITTFGVTKSKALTIECDYSYNKTPQLPYFTYLYTLNYHYICDDITINITSRTDDRWVTFVNGTHQTIPNVGIATNARVTVYAVNNRTLNYLPHKLSAIFTDLRVLWVNHCGLKEITNEDLQYPLVHTLNLDYNEIEVIYGNVFTNALYLYTVSLKNNRIKEVHYGTFSVPTSTTVVYLFMANNPCHENDTATASNANMKILASKIYQECDAAKLFEEKQQKYEKELQTLENESAKCAEHCSPYSSLYVYENNLKKNCLRSLKKSVNNQRMYHCNVQKNELKDLQNFKRRMLDIDMICKVSGVRNESCEVQNLRSIDSETELRIVKFNDCDELITTPLNNVQINKQRCSYIPHKFSHRFAHTKKLSIFKSGLLKLRSTDFEGFAKMEEMNLQKNKLSVIGEDIFDTNMKTVKILDLSWNNIELIEDHSFENLINLIEIHLNHNTLGSIKTDFLSKNKNLERVYLQGNHLTEVSPQMLYHMEKINYADFTNNKCINIAMPDEQITTQIITKCSSPVTVECEFKITEDGYTCDAKVIIEHENINLEKINGEQSSSYTLEDVKALVIENQTLNYFPEGIFKYLPNLKTIIIKNSQLRKIKNADFEDFSKLEKLEITENPLEEIESDAFASVNLKKLDLSSNEIEELSSNTFSRLTNLQILLLNDNKISKLERYMIPCSKTLKEFSMAKNSLDDVDVRIWKCFSSSANIDFTENECVNEKFSKPDELLSKLQRC